MTGFLVSCLTALILWGCILIFGITKEDRKHKRTE